MSRNSSVNRQVTLASRPVGAPTLDDFKLVEAAVPEPGEGEVLLRNLYLSLDPYMRSRMNDGPSYAEPVAIGEVMGAGTVARVVSSRHADFAEGELVLAQGGWQDYFVSDGRDLNRLDAQMQQPSLALGVLGMPGFTAWVGLLEIGQPQEGETVVVAAASGAVGSVVGQIAKIKGCRVVGIAGGEKKCRYVADELGFDACIDHRAPDFADQLQVACGEGIDVYFESVGGAVFDAVLPLLNTHARIPLCGLIAHYNDTELPPGPDRLTLLTRTLLTRRIKMQGFIIFDHYESHYDGFYRQMSEWLKQGRIKFREDIVDGLENAPEAFIGLLEGRNFGKLVVRVSE